MTRVVLSKIEVQRLCQALALAVDETKALIDAHQTEKIFRKGVVERFAPAVWRKDLRRWEKDIAAFQQLSRKLKQRSEDNKGTSAAGI